MTVYVPGWKMCEGWGMGENGAEKQQDMKKDR